MIPSIRPAEQPGGAERGVTSAAVVAIVVRRRRGRTGSVHELSGGRGARSSMMRSRPPQTGHAAGRRSASGWGATGSGEASVIPGGSAGP